MPRQHALLIFYLVHPLFGLVGVGDRENAPHDSANVIEVSPDNFEAFITRRACSGPGVIHFRGAGTLEETDEESLAALRSIAEELAGMATIGAVNCARWPVLCREHNLHELPVVILYPARGAAYALEGPLEKPKLLAGIAKVIAKLDKTLIVDAENIEQFLSMGRPFNVLFFTRSKAVPLVIQALSGDDQIWPLVQFGMVKATDKDIMMEYHIDESKLPVIMIQMGNGQKMKEVYSGGEASFLQLREWFLGHLNSAALTDSPAPFLEDDTGAAAMFGSDVALEHKKRQTAPKEDVPYEMLENGASACPDGSEILSVDECRKAISLLGQRPSPAWVSNYPELPRHCSIRRNATGDQPERMHFNSAASGQGRGDLAPVCKKREAPSKSQAHEPSASTSEKPAEKVKATSRSAQGKQRYRKLPLAQDGCPEGLEISSPEECELALEQLGIPAQPAWVSSYPELPRFCSVRENPTSDSPERMHFNRSPSGQGRQDLHPVCRASPADDSTDAEEPQPELAIPELTGVSYQELWGKDGLSLILLTGGRIKPAQVQMLLSLQEEFKSRLEMQGTKLRWMWMDVYTERKYRTLFDPPALPSAVILNPHSRPRFAAVKHPEEDEEQLPVDGHAISVLLNSVLDGDARFSSIQPKKLTAFVARSSYTKT